MCPEYKSVYPHRILEKIATELFATCKAQADLSHAVVVLPSLVTANDLTRALFEISGGSLVLPEIRTFRTWSETIPKPFNIIDRRYLEVLIFHELEKYDWLDRTATADLAADLVSLLSELDKSRTSLSGGVEDLGKQLEVVYQAQSLKLVSFEARLVSNIWNAFSGLKDGFATEEFAFRYGLAKLLERERRPVFVVAYPDLTPIEHEFIQSYSNSAPVIVFEPTIEGKNHDRQVTYLHSVYGDRRNVVSREVPEDMPSPWANCLRFFGAFSLDDEVSAISVRIKQWLDAGETKIGIVVLDRKVARRLRAVLERSNILIRDESGWRMSTTSIAALVIDWLDLIEKDFDLFPLIRFLKFPMIQKIPSVNLFRKSLEDWVVENRKIAYQVNLQYVLDASSIDLRGEYGSKLKSAIDLLKSQHSNSYTDWIDLALKSLKLIGIYNLVEDDIAGRQLLSFLKGMGGAIRSYEKPVRFENWLVWIRAQLETERFKDETISSPIVFTNLRDARLRKFDALVFAGADDQNFPIATPNRTYLSDAVRAQLGLRTANDEVQTTRLDLSGALLSAKEVLVTWQRTRGFEPNILSPWFELFRAEHLRKWNSELADDKLEAEVLYLKAQQESPEVMSEKVTQPKIHLDPTELPRDISVSDYQSLLSCPYQFFTRKILKLRDPEKIDKAISKRDYGSVLHKILEVFHRRFAVCSDVDRSVLELSMAKIAAECLDQMIGRPHITRGWLARIERLIPPYIEWQLEREANEWNIHDANSIEQKKERFLLTESGSEVRFYGVLDRVDSKKINSDPKFSILDYKTQSSDKLRKMSRDYYEHPQLLSYLALQDSSGSSSKYLSIDKSDVKEVELETEDIQAAADHHISRLRDVLSQIEKGNELPANGDSETCSYCAVSGMCRKQFSWS